MKYAIALIVVMVPTICVALSVFHGLIMPYVAPFGLLSFMSVTGVFGMGLSILAEYSVDHLATYLETRFP